MGTVDETLILLADADVLIDFAKTQSSILRLISQHLGQLVVLEQVLEEVEVLTKGQCVGLGIQIFSPDTQLLLEAAASRGALSFNDRLGFVVCRARSWTMVTNDRALIRTCQDSGIQCRRGLRLILDLVAGGNLTKRAARALAAAIHEVNNHHINAAVLAAFERALADL